MTVLTMTKHHGSGNDFLVLLDLDDATPVDGELARALCDRRHGFGADGVIRAIGGGAVADLTMQLRNADGSEAEMSGNGIRCMAQAAHLAGVLKGREIVIATGAGPRGLELIADTDSKGISRWSVEMGTAKVEDTDIEGGGSLVDLGNPHLVLRDTGQDLTALGAQHPDKNIELVAIGDGVLQMRVWERGVGATLACGTGSVAAAAAAHAWGEVPRLVTVENPGGHLVVDLGPPITLTGPSQYVGRVEFTCR